MSQLHIWGFYCQENALPHVSWTTKSDLED